MEYAGQLARLYAAEEKWNEPEASRRERVRP